MLILDLASGLQKQPMDSKTQGVFVKSALLSLVSVLISFNATAKPMNRPAVLPPDASMSLMHSYCGVNEDDNVSVALAKMGMWTDLIKLGRIYYETLHNREGGMDYLFKDNVSAALIGYSQAKLIVKRDCQTAVNETLRLWVLGMDSENALIKGFKSVGIKIDLELNLLRDGSSSGEDFDKARDKYLSCPNLSKGKDLEAKYESDNSGEKLIYDSGLIEAVQNEAVRSMIVNSGNKVGSCLTVRAIDSKILAGFKKANALAKAKFKMRGYDIF
jgi:hypothetical protein